MLVKYNYRFRRLFLDYIEKYGSMQTSYGNYYNPNNGYKWICFYEWSNMSSGSKTFKSVNDFLEFLKESNISITESQLEMLNSLSYCYCTCIPNKRILLITNSYYTLKEQLEARKNIPCTALAVVSKH